MQMSSSLSLRPGQSNNINIMVMLCKTGLLLPDHHQRQFIPVSRTPSRFKWSFRFDNLITNSRPQLLHQSFKCLTFYCRYLDPLIIRHIPRNQTGTSICTIYNQMSGFCPWKVYNPDHIFYFSSSSSSLMKYCHQKMKIIIYLITVIKPETERHSSQQS